MNHLSLKTCALSAGLWLVATSVFAHVGFIPTEGVQDSYTRFALKVPHGCAGQATDTVRIQLPLGIQAAKPMPKTGWTLNTVREPLAQPYTQHGKTIRDDVRELIWSQGNLPDAFYDEFVFQAKLTAQPGTMYFTVTQQCGTEQLRWDATTPDARYPAPAFKVLPKMPSGDATHIH